MQKVLITDYEYEDIEIERKMFAEAGMELVDGQWMTAEELIPVVKDVDGIITQYADINRSVIEAAARCRIVIKYGIGVNNIDSQAATERGIYVCNIPDYGVDEVTNQVIAYIFALMRKFYITNPDLRSGIWDYKRLIPIYRFSRQTVGIVGFGRMGQELARKLGVFGVRLIACDPYFDEAIGKKLNVEQVSFDTLVEESDFVTLHCPSCTDNQGLFNDAVFEKMKTTAYIINTARGAVIDEDSLVRALEGHRIAGAGIDVFEEEPISSENPLLKFPNVMVSGHTSWYSETAIENLHTKAAAEVINVLRGNKPFHLCNREVLKNIKCAGECKNEFI